MLLSKSHSDAEDMRNELWVAQIGETCVSTIIITVVLSVFRSQNPVLSLS